tara:strand:- start:267 stop:779 length:513 start_codon:yes stop_codon:yes gene_type:complete
MSEYRNRTSGAVNTQGEIRRSMPNTSLPRVWTSSICDSLGIDPVLAAPAPEASGEYKLIVRNGVVQDANNNWVQAYVERDMFADYVDDEGATVTKSSQEEAYTTAKNATAATAARTTRDGLIASCDWMAIKAFEGGTTVSTEWATYRQALRDVSAQEGFPNEIVWPTQPE